MLKLYSIFRGLNEGELVDLTLQRLYNLQRANILKMVDYYNRILVPVDINNPIAKLCHRLDFQETNDMVTAYNIASEKMEDICMPIGITTSINKGEIFKGFFYGEETTTAIVAEQSAKNRNKVILADSWEELKPLEVLSVPSCANAYSRPDLITGQKGTAVLAVDVPTMAAMFIGWRNENVLKSLEAREPMENFVSRWVMPSAMFTQMDAITFKGVYDIDKALEEDKETFSVPLAMHNQTSKYLKSMKEHMVKMVNFTLERKLKNIPSFNGNSIFDNMPDISDRITPNNEWALVAGNVPLLRACSKWSDKNPDKEQLINAWGKMDRHISGSRILKKAPDQIIKLLEDEYLDLTIDFLE